MIKDNERRILCMSMIYFKENHNLAVPKLYKCEFEGKAYSFGSIMSNVKNFFYTRNDPSKNQPVKYSEKLLKFLQALDPRVFERCYAQNLYREKKEKKLLKHFRQYFAENGDLAMKQKYSVKDDQTGEIVFLGSELVLIRQYVRGNKKNIYDQSFIDEIKSMDPKVFDFRYPKTDKMGLKQEKNLSK